ncbi:MAG: hypothetical protein U1A72_19885 [Sulfuritalea sp.]|nr:hypothetical protein [Sulfuritalea sp.]
MREVGFAADAARLTSEPKRTENNHLSRADALGPDLLAIAGTSRMCYQKGNQKAIKWRG